MKKSATFSEDLKNRYLLTREWDIDKPYLAVIGLNPSVANQYEDDPTIRRVISFAKLWGYGGFYMLNVYSQVATDPNDLRVFGEDEANIDFVLEHCRKADEVLCAWGSKKGISHRADFIMRMLKSEGIKTTALHINKNGSPKHPLYVKSDIMRVFYPEGAFVEIYQQGGGVNDLFNSILNDDEKNRV